MITGIKQKSKELIRSILPLSLRKQLCIGINSQKWLSLGHRYWWTMELLKDFAKEDGSSYHRFLWSKHLAYAESYELERRFGEENMKESRRMFFSDLKEHLEALEINPSADIRSVFEVGCSLGYQLHYLETNLFTGATEFYGIDIDSRAIREGSEYLKFRKSKVQLMCSDMGNLNRILNGKIYDIIICTGVLMYLEKEEAMRVVREMLAHSRMMVALSGPACLDFDNCALGSSVIRSHDVSLIHNLDEMVRESGGKVIGRRWGGNRIIDGHSIYFVFATGDLSPA